MNLAYKDIVIQLSFGFEKKSVFFNDLKCTFNRNLINFIVGPNGIGKSTLLRLLQGRIYEDEFIEGLIVINNIEYQLASKKNQELLNKISRVVVQDYNNMLALDFMVYQNLCAAKLPKFPLFNFRSNVFNYIELLQEVGINLQQNVRELSGGQRQILAIIMAMQKPVELLFLDEPTAALDDINSKMVMDFLTKLVAFYNVVIVCICHDKELIRNYAQSYFEIIKNENNQRNIERKLS